MSEGESQLATTRAARIARLLEAATNKHTRSAKQSDLRQLAQWQEAQGMRAGLPVSPEEFLAWLDWLAFEAIDPRRHYGRLGFAQATIARKAASVSAAHRVAGFESPLSHPAVAAWFRGFAREAEPQKHARPLRIEQLIEVVRGLGDEQNPTLRARDRAVLLLGFAAALRRSELAGLDVGDFELAPKGAIVTVRRSKTDQEGRGVSIAIYRRAVWCPVEAVREWLTLRAERTATALAEDAPLFVGVFRDGSLRKGGPVRGQRLGPRTVDAIVKARCEAVGLVGYSAHSLRAGFCVSAREAGATEFAIRRTTRHRSQATLHRYFSGAGLFDEDPFARLDLGAELNA